jgi:hypothetical protein
VVRVSAVKTRKLKETAVRRGLKVNVAKIKRAKIRKAKENVVRVNAAVMHKGTRL